MLLSLALALAMAIGSFNSLAGDPPGSGGGVDDRTTAGDPPGSGGGDKTGDQPGSGGDKTGDQPGSGGA